MQQPRLLATAGPLKGKTFQINDPKVSIGRDATNLLPIEDVSVSRNHCCIVKLAEEFKLEDLDSLNGTYLNDVRVIGASLNHGDRIQIGNSQFFFLVRESNGNGANSADPDDDFDLTSYTTVKLNEDSIYLTGRTTTALPSTRILRDLSALFRISHSISVVKGTENLERHLLDLLFEAIPAERGAILCIGHNSDTVLSMTCRQRSQSAPPWKVSRTVTQQVFRDGIALMSNDVLADANLSGTTSLTIPKVRSLLCVPLRIYDAILGAIYLDTGEPGTRFDEGHLQFLSAIASIAAVALDHRQYVEWLEGENQRLQEQVDIEHEMVGDSAAVRNVHHVISKVAPHESTVLIKGESGTGKELVARAIHKNSSRAAKPFVAINCAALAENLLESELFGHEKGAFTDACSQKKGRLELAAGGTLFLDEIGELAPRLQAKLLRVLQERELNRVGGNESIKVDIRVIAATNRDLEEAIKRGLFRQDLYFRLNVVCVTMPPLRERREDIPLLAAHFIKKYGEQCNRNVIGITREALTILRSYEWPGNVRELENAIERAVVLGQTDRIIPEDLPEFLSKQKVPSSVTSTRYHEAVQQLKRHLIIDAVAQGKGIYVEAARILGLHPNYLHRLIREMDLKEELRQL